MKKSIKRKRNKAKNPLSPKRPARSKSNIVQEVVDDYQFSIPEKIEVKATLWDYVRNWFYRIFGA